MTCFHFIGGGGGSVQPRIQLHPPHINVHVEQKKNLFLKGTWKKNTKNLPFKKKKLLTKTEKYEDRLNT